MTSVLGKRKSRRAEKDPAEVAAAQEKLRKYFESQYAPIAPTTATKKEEEEEGDGNGEVADERSDDESAGDDNEGSGSDSDEDDDEWGGLSEDDEDTTTAAAQQPQIEVVEHTDISRPTSLDPTLRKASRAYLSSKVPSALPSETAATAKQSSKAPKDEDTATLLRDDLALQRLLTESHLFNSTFGAAGAGNGVEHEGRNRHKATDLRLAALGSKDSIYKQAKMPMGHRKGIIAAAEKREDKRRREARENGIVLERATAGVHEGWTGLKGKKSRTTSSAGGGGRKREAAVDAPAVGKLRNGLLQLSKKDIREIEGSGGGSSRGGKGGGKKRRR
ncbi:isochorismatase family protein [Apiospora arundinis]